MSSDSFLAEERKFAAFTARVRASALSANHDGRVEGKLEALAFSRRIRISILSYFSCICTN